MGKKFFGVIAFVAIATAAGWNYQQNVEALARNESGKNNKALAQKANGEYCCTPLNGNNCTQSPACQNVNIRDMSEFNSQIMSYKINLGISF